MPGASKFRYTDVPRQPEELARFKVVQGPDYGSVYVVTQAVVTIGRGEENDLIITDLKASRNHAELTYTVQGWFIKDKGSSNGIIFNGQSVRQTAVKIGDTLGLGETTLEFVTADAATAFLRAPAKSAEEVQKKWFSQVLDPSSSATTQPPTSSPSGAPNSSLLKNPKILLIAAGLGIFFFLPGENKPVPKKKAEKGDLKPDLKSYLAKPEFNKTADTIFKEGLREYFSANYSRARTQFETVLQILPQHEMATLYLENCNKSIAEEVKVNLQNGKRAFESGKLRDSRAHFERVQQLLYKDQSNPSFIEARDQLEKVNLEIKGEDPAP